MFFHKKTKVRQDMRDIKEAMEAPEEMPSLEQPPAMERQTFSQPPAANTPAPLFVKVDKYREMLITVRELKLFLSSAKQVFATLHELESLRNDAINIMRANIQRMEKSVMEMDSTLLKPHGVSMAELGIAQAEVRSIDTTLTDLQRQLEDLRAELQGQK